MPLTTALTILDKRWSVNSRVLGCTTNQLTMVMIFLTYVIRCEHGQQSHQCRWQGWLASEQVRLDEVQTGTCQLAPSGPQDFQQVYALWVSAMMSQVQAAPK